jgi:GntR family transcriptional regulator/MocR family aminotransferase
MMVTVLHKRWWMKNTIELVTLLKNNPIPLYRQIYQQLRGLILNGVLAPAERLPSSRALAAEWEVARVTVLQALQQLTAEGYLVRRRGAGTFVCPDLQVEDLTSVNPSAAHPFAPPPPTWVTNLPPAAVHSVATARPEIDFGFGRSFAHTFPYDIWRRLLARYLSTDDAMLSRFGSVAGFYPLREALAAYLTRTRGMHCTAEQIVIVSGAQQALDIICRIWLPAAGEVLVESPGYVQAYTIFRAYGAALQPLFVDARGVPVAQIPAASRARMIFVTPSNQFPHGGSLPVTRRLALLAWARRQDALIIEDDYDGELRYDGRPLAALQSLDQDGRVIYLGNFSKVLFPALRLSYVVLPPALVDPFLRVKRLLDRGAPTLTQAAVADFMTEGHFERHLRHLRKTYGRRQRLLREKLPDHFRQQVCFTVEPAGLHLMFYLPSQLDEEQFVAAAYAAGVGIYPGAPYHLQTPPPPSVLLGFSGVADEAIAEGIRRLTAVFDQLMAETNPP